MLNWRGQRTVGLLVALAVLGPVVGVLTVFAALLLGHRSPEDQNPASAVEYLALLVPVLWGTVAYRATRGCGARRPVAALAAVLTIFWAVGSVVLIAEFA